ncbi:terminal uridylyltransferase Tailor-like [Musca vetustissima]|uniref:terminal uridylyltransferase Tailor-like n=1 Tax=Musca vetustissima TaxID=27455 RepID=UPI002AB755C3|nr:terminal uridylyltransferase Tailor-like [Musca vetustissima]
MGEVQKYIHPITIEAKLFAENMNKLCSTPDFYVIDPQLAEALENVMTSINNFLEKSTKEIVPTENTKLVELEKIQKLQRLYRCQLCRRDLGGQPTNVALHLTEECMVVENGRNVPAAVISNEDRKKKKEERKERKAKRKEDRLQKAVVLKKKARLFLASDQITAYQQLTTAIQIGDKLKCIPDYEDIEKDLLDLIIPLFPNQTIKIYKFGSRISGIGTRDSDLDLFIDIGDTFKIYHNRADQATIDKLNKVRKALKNHKQSWKGLVAVEKARVPILKVIHGSTSIECDINFSNSLGHINTQLMEYLFGLQPIARILCIYMKKWLHLISMRTEFNTYTLNLMVIFYLQTLKHLPPLSILFDKVDTSTALFVGPWLATYTTPNLKDLKINVVNTSKLIELIAGFFEYYMNFDYNKYIVCPYKGELVEHSEFNKFMPDRYINYVAAMKDHEIELNKPMIIQDPIQLNHNITKGISGFTVKVFREFMSKSLQIILQNKKP